MKIYLELLGEGTPVWSLVEAVHIHDDLYRITQVNAQPDDECWPFETDSIVRCMSKTTQEGDVILVAHERAKDRPQS
jgi:hypothetical protein